jgi:hypothetical protein
VDQPRKKIGHRSRHELPSRIPNYTPSRSTSRTLRSGSRGNPAITVKSMLHRFRNKQASLEDDGYHVRNPEARRTE